MAEVSRSEPQEQARVRLILGFKEWVGDAPYVFWSINLEMNRVDTGRLREETESIVRQHRASYSIVDRRGTTSWGADSGEVVEVILFVGKSMAEGLIASATLALWQKLVPKPDPTIQARAVGREEAIERAKWYITAHYVPTFDWSELKTPQSEEELSCVGEAYESSTNTWTITLKAEDFLYRVTYGTADGLPCVDKVERWRDTSAAPAS